MAPGISGDRGLDTAGQFSWILQKAAPILLVHRNNVGFSQRTELPIAQEAHMPLIFVDTDNSNLKDKLYNGKKAGASAGPKAEAKMQAVVKRIIDKSAGFTTAKFANAKGYAIRLEISKLEVADHKTECSLSGSIVRYPKLVTKRGAKGDDMLSLGWKGSAAADGTSEGALLDCVEAIAESMMAKGIPIMRADFLKR
jgi:hypothetical protein